MDLIADYSESEETNSTNKDELSVNIAPPTAKLTSSTSSLPFPTFNTKSVTFNPEYDALYTPVQGIFCFFFVLYCFVLIDYFLHYF